MARVVLGIDAAWTFRQPSGVAIATETEDGWQLLAAAYSYEQFHRLASAAPELAERSSWHTPIASELLHSATHLAGHEVTLVAVDMPLSVSPIVGRRVSDDKISRAYGAKKCSTHSPSETRPGRMSDLMRKDFESLGYPLQTSSLGERGLIEVYPHPSLVELADSVERLPYKVCNARKYWPGVSPAERRMRLIQEWRRIVSMLKGELKGVADLLLEPELGATASKMKAFEDALDAVVCAWVGVCVLEGRAAPFGDSESAIWVPTSRFKES